MSDPLVRAIAGEFTTAAMRGFDPSVTDVAAAVRAHLAAVLDAEEAAAQTFSEAGLCRAASVLTVNNLRSALGVEPVAKEAEG